MDHLERYERKVRRMASEFDICWGVRDFQMMDTSDGVAFYGKVAFIDLIVATIENEGHGGPNTIRWLSPEGEEGFPAHVRDARQRWRAIVSKGDSFAEELAVEALLQHAGV